MNQECDIEDEYFEMESQEIENLSTLNSGNKSVTKNVTLKMSSTCMIQILQLGIFYTLSGRTGSALAWRSEGRTFASQSV